MEQHQAATEQKTPRKPVRVPDLQKMLVDRDETILLLNEALSQALDELSSTARAA